MNIRKMTVFVLAALVTLTMAGCAGTGAAADGRTGVTATEPTHNTQTPTSNQPTSGTEATTGNIITKAQAIAIALEHAGLTEGDITGLWAEYELDDGVPEYDVEFHHGNFEYAYDIHAQTGEIRSYSRED